MAIVRVLVPMSGAQQSWATGSLYECDDASAARLVAAGRAEWIDPPAVPVIETAMQDGGPERAVRPRGKGRR
jgi:hypothetical protein